MHYILRYDWCHPVTLFRPLFSLPSGTSRYHCCSAWPSTWTTPTSSRWQRHKRWGGQTHFPDPRSCYRLLALFKYDFVADKDTVLIWYSDISLILGSQLQLIALILGSHFPMTQNFSHVRSLVTASCYGNPSLFPFLLWQSLPVPIWAPGKISIFSQKSWNVTRFWPRY